MNIGLYVIGDEILSGKRQDKHFDQVKKILLARGLQLSWVSYLGDDQERIAKALRQSLNSNDLVFCCGGIGGTPDDHTRQAAALALDVETKLHPEAHVLIAARCRENNLELTPERLRMGEFPVGSSIIPNPHNGIPGFSVGQHYFMPGFPIMAWPMIEWVLDTHFQHIFQTQIENSFSLYLVGAPEATLTPLMEKIEAQFSKVKAYSYPSIVEGQANFLELGVKSYDAIELKGAIDVLKVGVAALGFEFHLSINEIQ